MPSDSVSKNKVIKKRKAKEVFHNTLLSGGVIVILLLGWEIFSRLGLVNPQFTSSPSRVFGSAVELIKDGTLVKHILASGEIFIMGYLLAAGIGIPVGILLGWFKKARIAFGPLIAAMYTTPRIALMPLFIIWFGIGPGSKIALVFLSAVFPLIVNMQVAIANVSDDLTTVARAYGASERQIFWTIALPESVPFLMTGLRLATGRALLGVIGAEVFGGSEGIGYLIEFAGATFQTDKIFVGVLVIALIGIIMDRTLLILNEHFDKWRGNDA